MNQLDTPDLKARRQILWGLEKSSHEAMIRFKTKKRSAFGKFSQRLT
jgi:hypothetical protein